MMELNKKRILFVVLGLGVAALIASASKPKPVAVDLAQAARGPMRVTMTKTVRRA
ncbi:MAG: hypothetical protein ACREI7_02185 [Myxococcota bacterium]